MDSKEVKYAKKTKPNKKTFSPAYKCDQCSKQFNDKSSLIKHRPTHFDETPFACTLCEYAGKTKQYLRRHVKVMHGTGGKFSCNVCGKTFHYACKLKNHMRVHTGEKPYKCTVCDKAFNSSYSFNTHKLIHADSKPFQCSFCPYACRDSSTLRKHQARHMGQVTYYQCSMCDVSCKSKANLRVHVAEKHFQVDMRRMECDACGRRFRFRNQLVNHIRAVHEKSTRAKCDVCGIVISNKGNLKYHMRIHVDLKPFMCTVEGCGKRFKHTSSLQKHAVVHYPEKHFPCKICNRRFAREKRMRAHLKTHMAKVKNVECDYCGVCFYNKNYLTTHIQRKHGRKKQKYICDLCGLKTSNKPSIVMHIKYGHQPGKVLKCGVCEKQFKRDLNLKLHYWMAHGMDYEVPRRKRKCKKSKSLDVKIKEEPCETMYDGAEYLQVSPKIEPLDEEGLEELNLTSTVEANELEDIPKEMIEEFITPVIRGSDEDRRLKHKHDMFVDKKSEEQVKKEVNGIMEKARQKIAARKLERVRRKYNRLIRRAVKARTARKVRHKTIKSRKNKKPADSLLVEDFSINQTIDSKDRIIDKANINDIEKQDMANTKRKEIENIEQGKEDVEENETDEITDNEIIEDSETNLRENSKLKINKRNCKRKRIDNIEEEDIEENVTDCVDDETTDEEIAEESEVNLRVNSDRNKINTRNSKKVTKNRIEQEDVEENGTDDEIIDKEFAEDDADKTNANEKSEAKLGENRKLKINTSQCYVCFKLYPTKKELLDHCKEHFDLCNVKTLKKCPLCEYTTDNSVTTHLKRQHNIHVKVPYGNFKDNNQSDGSRYYYEVNDKIIKKVEIIPSVKHLNKRESLNIDKKNRENKNKNVLKNRLVKKGKEWIVMTEKVKINDFILPKFDKIESKNVNGGYLDRLKELYKIAKKEGKKMLFPCDSCDKVCQTLSALKLHGRKHEANPKPFKPKVWKHKNNNKDDAKGKQAKNKAVTINKDNRTAKPKPVVNNHKCDKELIEFYNRNIRGGDIEFWQFLKIYNKMGRENVNDFDDLQKSTAFGLHCNISEEKTSELTAENSGNDNEINNKSVKKTSAIKKTGRNAFTRVIRLSRREMMRREEVRRRLREKIKQCTSE